MILAFDTATAATVVGLQTPAGVLTRRDDPPAGARPNHAASLLGLCDELLAEAGAGWNDVARIGVGVGPGTFTGLRIGVATGRALAQASGAELAAVSTLQALARGSAGDAACLALIDARRGELFAGAWLRDGAALIEPQPVAPGLLTSLLTGDREWLAIGDGALRYREQVEAAGTTVLPDDDPRHRVDGAALCALAATATPVPVEQLLPDYLRLPDAEIARRAKAAAR